MKQIEQIQFIEGEEKVILLDYLSPLPIRDRVKIFSAGFPRKFSLGPGESLAGSSTFSKS